MKYEIEKAIRAIMDKKGVTVYRIALHLNVCYDSARQSLTTFTRPLRSHEFVKICKLLEIDIADLEKSQMS